MCAQLDLVEDALQLGIGEGFVAAADGDGETVERRARDAAREQPVAYLVEHVEQVLAMLQTLRPAVQGIVHALKRQDVVERSQRTGCGDGLWTRLGAACDAERGIAAARALRDATDTGGFDPSRTPDL